MGPEGPIQLKLLSTEGAEVNVVTVLVVMGNPSLLGLVNRKHGVAINRILIDFINLFNTSQIFDLVTLVLFVHTTSFLMGLNLYSLVRHLGLLEHRKVILRLSFLPIPCTVLSPLPSPKN